MSLTASPKKESPSSLKGGGFLKAETNELKRMSRDEMRKKEKGTRRFPFCLSWRRVRDSNPRYA